jgi:hypothetical protein
LWSESSKTNRPIVQGNLKCEVDSRSGKLCYQFVCWLSLRWWGWVFFSAKSKKEWNIVFPHGVYAVASRQWNANSQLVRWFRQEFSVFGSVSDLKALNMDWNHTTPMKILRISFFISFFSFYLCFLWCGAVWFWEERGVWETTER